MSTFRQNYVPEPVHVPREPKRAHVVALLAVTGVLWAWGTQDDGAEQRRVMQMRTEAFRAGYQAAQESACRPALATPIEATP